MFAREEVFSPGRAVEGGSEPPMLLRSFLCDGKGRVAILLCLNLLEKPVCPSFSLGRGEARGRWHGKVTAVVLP